MYSELVKALTEHGTARLEVTRDRPVRACRTQLIEAARRAGLRISMRKVTEVEPDFVTVVATVLNEAEGELQLQRDVIFRAVNRIRTGLEILTAGTIQTEPIKDEVEDLRDIARDLEAYARGLAPQQTGGRATG